jgi:hypothetical protein
MIRQSWDLSCFRDTLSSQEQHRIGFHRATTPATGDCVDDDADCTAWSRSGPDNECYFRRSLRAPRCLCRGELGHGGRDLPIECVVRLSSVPSRGVGMIRFGGQVDYAVLPSVCLPSYH